MEPANKYHTIVLPTRAQPDTLVAIFILKTFGEEKFPGVRDAAIDFWQLMPVGETEQSLDAKGIILLDIGAGKFDHHASAEKITTTDLVARYFDVADNPALAKFLEYARRDDFYGKGTISGDPIDRAFGLSGIVAALNKCFAKNPARVVDIIMPILVAHYDEEERRVKTLPEEFELLAKQGLVEIFEVKQRGKKLRVVILTSENISMAGFLRSQQGGKFDVVAQWLLSGHVNVLTRPTKHIDLRSLAVLFRLEEANRAKHQLTLTPRELSRSGRLPQIPEWYYDPATNSVQNGGVNPKDIPATRINSEDFKKILEVGLAETAWSPR